MTDRNWEYYFTCSLTNKLFYEPVEVYGRFFEKNALKKWLRENNYSSPWDEDIKLSIDDITVSTHFNSMLKFFYQQNQGKILDRFDYKQNHLESVSSINKIIKKKQFHKLLKYKNFTIGYLYDNNLLTILLQNAKKEIIEYVIDNLIDINIVDGDGWNLIHYVSNLMLIDTFKYLVDKKFDLECKTTKGWEAIHFICRNANMNRRKHINFVKYAIDLNINLETETYQGWRPLHLLCRHKSKELIKYIVAKNVDINANVKSLNQKNRNLGAIELIIKNKHLNEFDKSDLTQLICAKKHLIAIQPVENNQSQIIELDDNEKQQSSMIVPETVTNNTTPFYHAIHNSIIDENCVNTNNNIPNLICFINSSDDRDDSDDSDNRNNNDNDESDNDGMYASNNSVDDKTIYNVDQDTSYENINKNENHQNIIQQLLIGLIYQ